MIEATRQFVCIRIDSYESEEAQKIVRSYLNGRFENTAFCILSPDGKRRLTRSGRAPAHGLGRGDVARSLDKIAKKYRSESDTKNAGLPDFNSFRLALNVASAEERVLVLLAGGNEVVRKKLSEVAWSPNIIGRFEYDVESDPTTWTDALTKETGKTGILLVKADQFGQKGEVMAQLPLSASQQEIYTAMRQANANFAKTTEKKNYAQHMREGRRSGVTWKMPVEYGEDRDGDGKIDFRGGHGERPPRGRR